MNQSPAREPVRKIKERLWLETALYSLSFASLILAVFADPSHAETATWTGSTNGNWNNGSNWASGTLPTTGATVDILTATVNAAILSNPATVATVNIDNNTLTINAARLDISGSIIVRNNGQIVNNGTIVSNINNAGYISDRSAIIGNVNNTGVLNLATGGALQGNLTNTGTTENAGYLDGNMTSNAGFFTNTATGKITGTFSNTGTSSANLAGDINSAITNSGTATITITGILDGWNGSFTNNSTSANAVIIAGGNYGHAGTFTQNAGIVTITAPSFLYANLVRTGAGGQIDNSGTITSAVNNAGTLLNKKLITGNVTNSGSFTNSAALTGSLENSGTATNSGYLGGNVTNTAGTFTNTATGTIDGTFSNSGNATANLENRITGDITNSGTAKITVTGSLNGMGRNFTNDSTNADALVISGGNSYGNIGTFTQNAGTVTISAFGYLSAASFTVGTNGEITNSGTMSSGSSIANAGAISNVSTITGDLTNSGIFTNFANGTLTGNVTNSGTFTNFANATLTGTLANTGTTENSGYIEGNVTNTSGTFTNNAGAAVVGTFANSGTMENSGYMEGNVTNTAGTFTNETSAIIVGAFSNSGNATANLAGNVQRAISNSGTARITVTGPLNGWGQNFTNDSTNADALVISGGSSYGNIGTFTQNAGTVTISAGSYLTAGSFTIGANGRIVNSGTMTRTSATTIANAGTLTNNSTLNGNLNNSGTFTNSAGATLTGILANSGTILNSGNLVGNVTNTTNGTFTNEQSGIIQGTFSNSGNATANLAGSANGAITNSGTAKITVTGSLDGANNNFTNDSTSAAALVLSGGSFGRIDTFTQNAGTVSISATRVLSAASVNVGANGRIVSLGTIRSAISNAGYLESGGLLDGSVYNTGQLLSSAATSEINGNLVNSGIALLRGTVKGSIANNAGSTISTQDGVIGNLTVTGSVETDGSTFQFDTQLNNPAGQADTLTINGDFTGTFNVNFLNLGTATLRTAGNTTVISVTGASTATLQATTGLPQSVFASYEFLKAGNDWVIQTTPKEAPLENFLGGLVATQTMINVSTFQPSSGASQASDGCGISSSARQTGGRSVGEAVTNSDGSPDATSKVDVAYGGMQLNADYGCHDFDDNGSSIVAGLIGGFDLGSTGQNDPETGMISSSNFETRYVGAYVNYTRNDKLRASLHTIQSETNLDFASAVNGVEFVRDTNLKSERNTIGGEVSYVLTPEESIAITPLLGFTYSQTHVADAKISGLDGGRIVFDDIESLVGSAGVTVSKSYQLPGGTGMLTPYVGVKVYNDFAGPIVASHVLTTGERTPTYTQNSGLYGEISAGLVYASIISDGPVKKKLDADLRGDLKIGERVAGGRISANLHFQF